MTVPDPSWSWRLALHAMDLDASGDLPAEDVTYDNTTSGLTATDVQAAIDEVASGAATALTVEDEGTPLATAADTLDFVGAGVTASGTGTTKTITISGAPTGAAGGDLSGTYPNPSVVNDSHTHTSATVPTGATSTDTSIWRPLMDGLGNVMTDSATGEAIMAFGPA